MDNLYDPVSPWAEKIHEALAIAVMAAGWTALVLAEFGRFSLQTCLIISGTAIIPIIGLRGFSLRKILGDFSILLLLIIAAALLRLTIPAGEMILGGWDPGVYLHASAQISREGSILIEDEDLSSLSDLEKLLVARNLHGIAEPYGGMRSLPDGRVSPQFYHLYPSLMAIAWSFGGLPAALMVNPLLNILSVLAFYLLALKFFQRRLALLATLAFALNPAQIWQAKFSTSEMLAQFLLLSGFVFLGRAMSSREKRYFDAALCGFAFGLAFLTRYDVLLIMAPAMIFMTILTGEEKRGELLMIGGIMATLFLHNRLHHHFVAPYYQPLGHLVIPALTIVIGVLTVWFLVRPWPVVRSLSSHMAWAGKFFHYLGVLLFSIWALFATFIRPHLGRIEGVGKLAAGLGGTPLAPLTVIFAGPETKNIYHLRALLTSGGLMLAIIGIIILSYRLQRAWQRAWLYSSAAVLVILVTNIFHDHFMMWSARRFVPVVLPLMIIGLTASLESLGGVIGRYRPALSFPTAALVMLVILAFSFRGIAFISSNRDWHGLTSWFEDLAGRVPDRAILYSDQPGFAAPLRFIYGKRAFELHHPREEKYQKLVVLMGRKLALGEDIFYLTMKDPPSAGWLVYERLAEIPLKSSIMSQPRFSIPLKNRSRGGPFALYRLRLAG